MSIKVRGAALFSLACVIAAVCISAYFNFTSRGFDWYYFDSLAALIRSSIWHYGVLPIHDPWACSGTSVLANAQNWIFSPSLLFTLIFPPNLGNWLSLIVFKIFGFIGLYRYLGSKEVDNTICWLAAAWFVNLSWFSLHFAEGHVIFRGFYLLPWLLLWSENMSRPKSFLKLSALFCFLLLDGGIYPAIFGFLFCFLRAAGDRSFWRPFWNFLKANYKKVLLVLLACGLVLIPKILPVLWNSGNLKSAQEYIVLPLRLVLQSLFNPFWNNGDIIEGNLRFHELGNYLGIGCVLLIFALFIGREKSNRTVILFSAIALLFAWISFGWGGLYNPYSAISSLPFLEKLHVQTRYGILFSFALIILLSLWSSGKEPKKMFYVLFLLINLECLFAGYFSYYPSGENYELPMITREVWTKTIREKQKPLIYYSADEVSKYCYEPSQSNIYTKAIDDPGYVGEGESLDGDVKIDQLVLTPGRIHFDYTAKETARVILNEHYLDGWKASEARFPVTEAKGRIQITLSAGQGEVTLKYRPPYVWWIFISYILGLGLFGFLFRSTNEL